MRAVKYLESSVPALCLVWIGLVVVWGIDRIVGGASVHFAVRSQGFFLPIFGLCGNLKQICNYEKLALVWDNSKLTGLTPQ